ncbi:MAG: zinc-binding dehydrogenase [Gammaproteobacteria bacterium]
MKARQLWFNGPASVEVREQALPPLLPGQVLVENLYSAISAGTELLVYRGQLPDSLSLDDSLDAFAGEAASYPLQYGYAAVGRIIEVGKQVDPATKGRTVFSFQPHASHYQCALDSTLLVPDGIDPRAAVFLANMETAVNLVHDARPLLGERVIIMGQGIVGLLVSNLLAQYRLAELAVLEPVERRRELAEQAGVHSALSPDSASAMSDLRKRLAVTETHGGADVVIELTGNPEALNLSLELCGYSGRVVVGSWYGTKSAKLNLGERFHRNRIRLVSSQVSTIDPKLSGRWDKARRFQLAWEMIQKCEPEKYISNSIPLENAADAYQLLDSGDESALQVIFDYQSQ